MTPSRRRARSGCGFTPRAGRCRSGKRMAGCRPTALWRMKPHILSDCIRVIDRFHDPRPGAMVRVAVAPCSPFSVSRELMRDAALLARDKGVMMHTHLAENDEDVAYSLENFGCRPGQYAEDLGWTGDDVWHAHCVKLDGQEIDLFARTRLAWPIAPAPTAGSPRASRRWRRMRRAGVPVGLGVDGSASNDSGNLVAEARQAMLLQRVSGGAEAFSARDALRLATRGGAEILGRGASAGRSRRGSAPIWRSGTCPASRRRAAGTPPRCFWPVRRGCAT
jgi:cytosine/adenosine deaminase-related metal-dependent hydrolase